MKDPITVQDAIAVFDLAADRTRDNHQTKAWKILRTEFDRLREYEQTAGMFAIEKAELRRALNNVLDVLRDAGQSAGFQYMTYELRNRISECGNVANDLLDSKP